MIRMKLTVEVPTSRDAINLLDWLESQDNPAEISVTEFSAKGYVRFTLADGGTK